MIEFSLAPLLEDYGFPLAVMGVFVVFVALTLVVLFVTILPHVVKRISVQQRQESRARPADSEDQPSEEMLVIIAAAVAESVRVPHRIVRIRGLTPAELGWSLEGRMQHHQSHKIRRRDH